MGYTIYIIPKDEKLTKKMFDFLTINADPEKKYKYSKLGIGYKNDDGLSYVSKQHEKKNVIGFDYGAISGEERAFRFELLEWMSKVLTPESPKKYYYDGQPSKFSKSIFDETDPEKITARARVDFLLFELSGEALKEEAMKSVKKLKSKINKLDELWKKECKN